MSMETKALTVREVIDQLSKFPNETRVLTPGVDGFGYNDLESVRAVDATIDKPFYETLSQHGDAKDGIEGAETTPCVVLE